MTPEELIKLCDAAERPCDYSMADGGPPRGRVSNEVVSREAMNKLKDFGFYTPARARSYAKLLALATGGTK